jgi:hypothetical protein
MKVKLSLLTGIVLSFAATWAIGALHGESIILDQNTGDYTITYWDYPNSLKKRQLRTAIFVPATKINPAVISALKLRGKDVVDYSYRLKNGATSRQSLLTVFIDPVTDIVSAVPLPKRNEDVDINTIAQTDKIGRDSLSTPRGWEGSAVTSDEGGLRIGWIYTMLDTPDSGLVAGSAQEGFGFSSKDIPGIGEMRFTGHAPVPMYSAEGPQGDLGKEFEKLEKNNFVPRNAAVPTIAVPDPFDAATLLERIQTQMHTWIGMSLLDATFSSQLDRYFQSAISAYRLNQPKVGKKEIQTMRELLKKEHADADREDDNDDRGEKRDHDGKRDHDEKDKPVLIDKLAARVLDFDLKYVMKRMGGDKDDRF